MPSRVFHIGDVLSISTGRLLSTRGMDGIYDILNFMTNDNLFRYQLPRIFDECSAYVLKCHPILNDVDTVTLYKELEHIDRFTGPMAIRRMLDSWIESECNRLGIPYYLRCEQIPSDAHESEDP